MRRALYLLCLAVAANAQAPLSGQAEGLVSLTSFRDARLFDLLEILARRDRKSVV